jgi:hypothetical protein
MRLPVKKELFEQLKAGRRTIDYRDAHITFVCEETGETLVKQIDSVGMIETAHVPQSIREVGDIFTDEWVITFHWGNPDIYVGAEMNSDNESMDEITAPANEGKVVEPKKVKKK